MKRFEKNEFINSKLVCETSAKPSTIRSEYYGGRGITSLRDNVFTSFADLATIKPSPSANTTQLNKASYKDSQNINVTVWLKGFITPGKSSNYEFSIQTNGHAILFLSVNETSAVKVRK